MQKIKLLLKSLLRNNLILSILFSKFSSISSFIYDGYFCKIEKYDTYWLHHCSFGVIPYWHVVYRPEQKFNDSNLIFFSNYIPKKNDVVLEFGSGIGNEALVISKLIGPNGKIISLEPHPKIFDYLLKTISFNRLTNVFPEQNVISYSNKEVSFSNFEEDWLKNKVLENGPIKIQSITVDDLILKHNIKIVNFLKCNIEGAEIELLKIKQENIKKIQNISIECHDFLNSNNKNLSTFKLLYDFFKNNGFEIYQKYKKSENYPHHNFYIYASRENNKYKNDFFSLRDKNDYVSFNKILRDKLK